MQKYLLHCRSPRVRIYNAFFSNVFHVRVIIVRSYSLASKKKRARQTTEVRFKGSREGGKKKHNREYNRRWRKLSFVRRSLFDFRRFCHMRPRSFNSNARQSERITIFVESLPLACYVNWICVSGGTTRTQPLREYCFVVLLQGWKSTRRKITRRGNGANKLRRREKFRDII